MSSFLTLLNPALKKLATSLSLAISLALGLNGTVQAAPLVELSPEAQGNKNFNQLRQIEDILKAVSEIRELKVLRPIQIGILDRSQLQAKLAQQIKEEIPPEKLQAEADLYQQLDMLPPGFNYQQFLLELYTEQIGGFYDPKTRELKLIEGIPLTGLDQKMLIAHELTHALQDQHMDLQKFLKPSGENDDQTFAAMALIEGDATVAAMEYVQQQASKQPMQGLFNILGSLLNAANQMQSFEKLRQAPAFIQNSLIFPYDQGSQFVNAFRQQGWSWRELGPLYQNPPKATEHILHPNTYLDGETPQQISFSLQPFISGSKLISSSVWGELGYKQYFGQHLTSKEAKAAAQGWQGDRYEVLSSPSGQVYAFFSSWDSPAEATEFYKAWAKTLQKRRPQSKLTGKAGSQLYTSPEGLIWLNQQGAQVAIIEQLPKTANLIPSIEQAWKSAISKLKPAPAKPLRLKKLS